MRRIILILFAAFILPASGEAVETVLLIVGGNESACAAAVQAARLLGICAETARESRPERQGRR